jgi:cyclopropane fatty-acyl-phospholipid synthase-like methyltransferase
VKIVNRVESTGRKEEPSSYYDAVYRSAFKTGVYDTARFQRIYRAVYSFLAADSKVLECGCGTGVFAEMVLDSGMWYRGFDFSAVAITSCSDRVLPCVWRDSAYSISAWCRWSTFNTVVAIETFEHLDDLRVIDMIPEGVKVIFSVPNFDSRSHLRTYPPDIDGIQEYYFDRLRINRIITMPTKEDKIITVCDVVRV